MKLMNLLTTPNCAWIVGWRRDNCGCGIETEKRSLWLLPASQQMEWSACQASIHPLKNGSMVTRRRAFTLFRDGCVRLDIAAFSTLTWRTPHQIRSTGELDIERLRKLSAIVLSDLQPERVAAKPIGDASSANLPLSDREGLPVTRAESREHTMIRCEPVISADRRMTTRYALPGPVPEFGSMPGVQLF
jgi:hypothetical protein